jgi:hypothetical protein
MSGSGGKLATAKTPATAGTPATAEVSAAAGMKHVGSPIVEVR